MWSHTHTPLFFQLVNWGEPKVLHAIQACQIQAVFCFIAHLPRSSSSCILCCLARYRADQLLTLRHVISLFRASEQTLGLSREHERDDGHAPEIQGPSTTLYGAERTSWIFCSRAERRLSHSLSASATVWSTMLHLMHSQFGMQGKARNRLRWIGIHGKWQE